MLRKRIQSIIELYNDPEEAAIKICVMLDNELDLSGNGWFDEDEEVLQAIDEEDQDDS